MLRWKSKGYECGTLAQALNADDHQAQDAKDDQAQDAGTIACKVT